MAEDLEADPVSEVPVSETPLAPSETTSVTPVSDDPYDFDAPGYEQPVAETTTAAVAPPEPVAPVAPVLSDALAQRAAQIGYTPESIAAFKDPIQLEIAVRTAEQVATNVAMAAQRHYSQPQFAQPAPVQQPQQVQLPPAPVAPAAFNETAIRAECAKNSYDESFTNHLVSQGRGMYDQAVQLHQQATRLWEQDKYNVEVLQYMQRKDVEVQQMRTAHQQELVNRDFEQFHGSLPEQHKTLVAEQANKNQIYGMAVFIANGMANAGQQLPSNVEIFRMATNAVLGDKLYGAAVAKVRQEVTTHQNRSVARPSAGHAAPVKRLSSDERVEAAANRAEQFFRGLGIPAGAGSDSPDV